MDHAKRAQELFYRGYNCAQAVFCAFAAEMGLDLDTAARLSSSFGGGMGRLRELCGALAGAELALGMLRGYSDVQDPALKSEHYRRVRLLAEDFRTRNGTYLCRELLRDVPTTPGGEPEPRTPEFYARRPCLRLVGEAAAALETLLAREPPSKNECRDKPRLSAVSAPPPKNECRDKPCLSAFTGSSSP